MSMDFNLSGLKDLVEKLKTTHQQAHDNVKREMYQWAEEVMTLSKERVPVKTGALMNTGKVMLPVDNGTSITVELGYGDESIEYALIVHEELSSPSGGPINWTRPGSGPKYLENPFNEKTNELPPRVAKAYTDAFTK